MVLTKPELIGALQNEVRILLHLASKIEPAMVDYRPTPKQRSSIELLRYLSIMGPQLVMAAKSGFDPARWGKAAAEAEARTFGSDGLRSSQSGLASSIRLSFHCRGYFLIFFSR